MSMNVAGAAFAPLNAEQRHAVEHGAELLSQAGPLLVIAGAGTGKTETLAHRVAWLISQGVATERILLMTFSRRAAAEMVSRAGALLLDDASRTTGKFRLPWAGTFHSIAALLLRRHGERLGLNPAFTVLDRSDSADCVDWLRGELGLDQSVSRFPRATTCLAIYSDRINTDAPLAEVLSTRYPWCVQWRSQLNQLLRRYVEHKHAQALLDYDDLLLWWRLGMDDIVFAQRVRSHFDHVLVDEYQDSNRLQVELLTKLRPDGRGLFVVGDDAQSIYSFRGADVEHIYRFSGQFSPPARRVALSINYRSSQPILDTANALIAGATGPFDKSLIAAQGATGIRPQLVTVADDAAQSAWVVHHVLQQREAGVRLRDQAVLFRTAQHSDALEIDLARHNIPFVKYGGLKFVEAAHIKDAVALLRWAVNPCDTLAAFRILQLLEGVGPAIARTTLAQMESLGTNLPLATDVFGAWSAAPPRSVDADTWMGLMTIMQTIATPDDTVAVRCIALADWLAPIVVDRYGDGAARAADLQMLSAIARGFADLPALIEALALDPPGASGAWGDDALIDEDYLILSTVHSAKGQEWRNVMVINVSDGSFPNEFATGSPSGLAEERRLLYVAMTRARRQLHLIEPVRYYLTQQPRHGGAHVYGARSRFFDDRVLATLALAGSEHSGDPADAAPGGPAPWASAGPPEPADDAAKRASSEFDAPQENPVMTKIRSFWSDPPAA